MGAQDNDDAGAGGDLRRLRFLGERRSGGSARGETLGGRRSGAGDRGQALGGRPSGRGPAAINTLVDAASASSATART